MKITSLKIAVLSLIIGVSHPARANPWQDLAKEDLQTIYDVIKNDSPGPVDPLNPHFSDWMEDGLRQSKEMIKKVDSIESYTASIDHYVSGFNDGHIYFFNRYQREWVKWPQFTVGFRGSKLIVYFSALAKNLPAKGSELLSCDGKTVEQMLASNIYPYFGQFPTKSKIWYGPNLLADFFNPFIVRPAKCTFLQNGKSSEVAKS